MKEFKVGQMAFSTREGWAEIIEVGIHKLRYPYRTVEWSYDINGHYDLSDPHPTLFHSAQECAEYFAALPKPKRKIKVEAWVNIYPSGNVYSYATEKDADLYSETRLVCKYFIWEGEVDCE